MVHIDLPIDDGVSRRYRTAFTSKQFAKLEKEFLKENYVSRAKRGELATSLNLSEGIINVWFQNRRMKDKRQRRATTRTYGPTDYNMSAYLTAPPASYPYGLGAPATSFGCYLGMGMQPPNVALPQFPASAVDLRSGMKSLYGDSGLFLRPQSMMTHHPLLSWPYAVMSSADHVSQNALSTSSSSPSTAPSSPRSAPSSPDLSDAPFTPSVFTGDSLCPDPFSTMYKPSPVPLERFASAAPMKLFRPF